MDSTTYDISKEGFAKFKQDYPEAGKYDYSPRIANRISEQRDGFVRYAEGKTRFSCDSKDMTLSYETLTNGTKEILASIFKAFNDMQREGSLVDKQAPISANIKTIANPF